MKNKSKRILLGGSSVLVASSLVGSSMSVNVSADDEGFLVWIATNFWAFIACIRSYLSLSNGNVKKNNKNDVGTQKTSPKKERLERIGNLANKLEEKLGDKIQLSLDGKNGCYSGKIKFVDPSLDLNIRVSCSPLTDDLFCVYICGFDLRMSKVVNKAAPDNEKIDAIVNHIDSWYKGVEARLKKLEELAKTGRFDLVKNSDEGFVKLCPKDNFNLAVKDKTSYIDESVVTMMYDIERDELNFHSHQVESLHYSRILGGGFFNLCFSSNKGLGVNEKQASRGLSVFNRFVDQIKNSKDSNSITFEVSDENAAVNENQNLGVAESV